MVSTASGFPIAFIPEIDEKQNSATDYCKREGWHLITDNEWMTMARNMELVAENWCNPDGTNCGNAPGTKGKILANGHNNSKGYALTAGTDNQPCFGTTADGSNVCGRKDSQKRTLTLSNGEIVWDLAGNVWEWIDMLIPRKDQPQSTTNERTDKGWIWSEFSVNGNKSVIIGLDSLKPLTPGLNSSSGIGGIFHFSGTTTTPTAIDTNIRSGNWRHGNDSGIFTVHLSPAPTKQNIDDVGFRCAAEYK